MDSGIFSTYRQGENRVTASIIAVLKSLALPHIESLIGALLQEPEFQLVRFQNQQSRGGSGVPDAEITSDLRILLETKIKANAIDGSQLERHLIRLNDSANQYLIVLTPDENVPQACIDIDDRRLVWASFISFSQAIHALLKDETGVISERETYLLRELQKMFIAEGLVQSSKDTVVVAARVAWDIYHSLHAYVCQPFRSMQKVSRIAFYSSGEIQRLIPKIIKKHQGIIIEQGIHRGELGRIVDKALSLGTHPAGIQADVYELSPPSDRDTVVLDRSIPNDLRSGSGRTIPFTQGQRYVNAAELRTAKTTSDLVSGQDHEETEPEQTD